MADVNTACLMISNLGIGIKVKEGLIEGSGSRTVDAVALVGSVNDDDSRCASLLDKHKLGRIFIWHQELMFLSGTRKGEK